MTDPARCVYVGDRLFDDIWGARHAGMRAIHVPHSTIPAEQLGHSEGEPDAVGTRPRRHPGHRSRLALRRGDGLGGADDRQLDGPVTWVEPPSGGPGNCRNCNAKR